MKDSLKLLSVREKKEVLGKRSSNLWLLVIVMTVTFLSISFSNASMDYLSEKMDDPFTNWVDIKYENEIPQKMYDVLEDESIKARYGIKDFQADDYELYTFFSKDNASSVMLRCRFVSNMQTDLIRAILSEENVVGTFTPMDKIDSNGFGLIVKEDAFEKLRFTPGEYPSFINKLGHVSDTDTLGLSVTDDGYAPAPVPVIAVVKRLPSNMDIVGSAFFRYQERTGSLIMSNEDYVRNLIYFVKSGQEERFKNLVKEAMPDSLKSTVAIYEYNDKMEKMRPAVSGNFYMVFPFGMQDHKEIRPYIDIAERIGHTIDDKSMWRVHNYKTKSGRHSFKTFLSVNFERLDSIRAFESYMKNEFGIVVDMALINSKENFNAVSVLANILSWAMIVFSIVCIVLFIVNMLHSYFTKVKRNIGTFKAFGINTGELIFVYVVMLLKIVLLAIIMSLALSWLMQVVFPYLGILKDGKYSYLSLWSAKTVYCALTMVVSTVITVIMVMRGLLRKTPGDLIYDR